MTAAQIALLAHKEEPVLRSQNQVQECLHACRYGINCYYSVAVAIFTLNNSECRQHPVCILCPLNPCESWSGNIILLQVTSHRALPIRHTKKWQSAAPAKDGMLADCSSKLLIKIILAHEKVKGCQKEEDSGLVSCFLKVKVHLGFG